MFMSRGNCGICVLALALTLALVGAGWAQTAKPSSPDHAILYRRAVALLDQAQQKLKDGDLAAAKSLVKQSNSLFTLLQKEYASVLAERELSPQEDQQLAIDQKLADDTHAQADRLMATAAAQEKKAQELEAQGREVDSKASYRQSRDGYNRAQNLYVRSELHALRNQQRIFRFLAP
jgi:16S rRNA C1402 (ribose-2'-O) methylase RsmI